MTTEPTDPTGPLELLESARVKYTLAQARMRRGPAELALLSLHGSIEDALRAHALRREHPALAEPFPALVDALITDSVTPLTPAEADSIRRMHRVRARIAHGEQISLTSETLAGYQRLVARVLPRYGIVVVGPEDLPAPVAAIPPVRREERPRAEPPRERTVYPDDRRVSPTLSARSATERMRRPPPDDGRYSERTPSRGQRYLAEVTERAERFGQVQGWLVPALIVVSIFMIGLTLSIAWQQRDASIQPASPTQVDVNAVITTAEPGADTNNVPQDPNSALALDAPTPEPTPTDIPADQIAVGRVAFVRSEILGLNVRIAPDSNAQILFSLAPGTQMDVLDGPVEAGGFTWWEISSAGQQGWAAGEFMTARR
jgi:hypothetical protein